MALSFLKTQNNTFTLNFDDDKGDVKTQHMDYNTIISNVCDEVELLFDIHISKNKLERLLLSMSICYRENIIRLIPITLQYHVITNQEDISNTNSTKNVSITRCKFTKSLYSDVEFKYCNGKLTFGSTRDSLVEPVPLVDNVAQVYSSATLICDTLHICFTHGFNVKIVDDKPIISQMIIYPKSISLQPRKK